MITPAQLEAAARAHDREDSAYRGEPDPWSFETDGEDFPRFKSDRISCMRLAFAAAGVQVQPTGLETAFFAMSIPRSHRETVEQVLRQLRSRGRVEWDLFRALMEYLPGSLRFAATALGVGPAEASGMMKRGEVPAEPFLTLFDAELRREFNR